MEAQKRCSKCGVVKLTFEFYTDKTKKDKLKSQCKTCSNETLREYREAHYEEWRKINRKSVQKISLRRHAGITPEEYGELLELQDNACAICKKPPTPVRRFTVDRDPYTSDIRGLVCRVCLPSVRALDADPAKVIVLVNTVENQEVLRFANYILHPPLRGKKRSA